MRRAGRLPMEVTEFKSRKKKRHSMDYTATRHAKSTTLPSRLLLVFLTTSTGLLGGRTIVLV